VKLGVGLVVFFFQQLQDIWPYLVPSIGRALHQPELTVLDHFPPGQVLVLVDLQRKRLKISNRSEILN
jgi:hypothetical protein